MPSIKIKIDKTIKGIEFPKTAKIEEMQNAVASICGELFKESSSFDEKETFKMIYEYIQKYHRILYSQISSTIYAYFREHTPQDASSAFGTTNSNIQRMLSYIETQEYKDIKNTEGEERQKYYEDTEKVIMKIWDHANLAQTQYSSLKQTDEEYRKKFEESISPVAKDLIKDMNSQLLTMVSIFTALAFLVFGGISSLGSVFSNHEIPLLKVIIIGCVWGICIFNLVFVFLFCVGKMTGLNFSSTQAPDANIVQKYPIVWWTDLLILTVLAGSLWMYYIRAESMDSWFLEWSRNFPHLVMWGGFIIIAAVFIAVMIVLIKQTWKRGE